MEKTFYVVSKINWSATAEESALIEQICKRAVAIWHLSKRNIINTAMDITACHLNGTPLKLASWLAADDFDFLHDLYGIDRNMNRETGKLENCFLPRFAA
jgi:hypothetical protein